MLYSAKQINLNFIFDLLSEDFEIYGPKKNGNKITYDKITQAKDLVWKYRRTIMPFKKILYPNRKNISSTGAKKVAIFGMPFCDIAALNILRSELKDSDLLPSRDDIFIIAGDCQPDENCFCDQYDLHKFQDYDLYISNRDEEFLIETKSWRGQEILKKSGLNKSDSITDLKPKIESEKINLKLTEENINNKNLSQDFWHGVANNCFGCGACSVVCPLCFCFRQDYQSKPDGCDKICLNWDSCFGSEFSQIQNGFDLRPSNADRIYNWYHHKFVRAPHHNGGHPLCVGCGRCITACPAHLNIKNIIASLNAKFP